MTPPIAAQSTVGALERFRWLDRPAKAAGAKIRDLLPAGRLKDTVSGTWLGHPLHPLLTDLVIGSLVSASLVDAVAPRSGARAAERLIAVGIAAAVPTAVTGASDWADTELSDPGSRRVGLVHAAGNVVAQVLYAASLATRLRGRQGRGRLLALAGAGVLGGTGYLGAHMSYAAGVGVNQTAFDAGSTRWTDVIAGAELVEGRPRAVEADGTAVMLLRSDGRVYAIADRCSHRGCLLSDGELERNVVMCACHGSRFDVRDGTLLRGPATTGQPAFDTRDNAGRIEIRRR